MQKTKLTKREYILLSLLGMMWPFYPTLLIFQHRHDTISIWRIAIPSLINAWLLPVVSRKMLIDELDSNIRQYIDNNYSQEEQKNIITNYQQYKTKFLPIIIPEFTVEALEKDLNLKDYQKKVALRFKNLYVGFFLYMLLIGYIIFICAWL